MLTSLLFLSLLLCCFSSAQVIEPGTGVVTVYYSTSWTKPYIHYEDDSAQWTAVPGVTMDTSTNDSYPTPPWYVKNIASNALTFVFDNGQGTWDNNYGKNYYVSQPGIYTVASGVLSTVQLFNKGCPMSCNGHGTCNSDYKCSCDSDWYGPTCSCGGSNPCNGHGSCDSDGECVCTAPWATCSGSAECSVSVASDPQNCGACGSTCLPGKGIAAASCSNMQCTLTCATGYLLCQNDTVCEQGDLCGIPPLSGCDIFHDNQCSGDTIITDPSYANRKWFTPHTGDDDYKDSYQDYWRMTAYCHMVYTRDLKTATVTVIAEHADADVKFTYAFNGVLQATNTTTFTSTNDHSPVTVDVYASDGAHLSLQSLDFVWDAPSVDRTDGDFRGGQKGAIVEMFGWPHSEIEAECEYIAKMGWAGVKLYPPQEQVMSLQPYQNMLNPWFFMYQPMSYRLEGRMGTHDQLRSMIYTCRKYGVRAYADAVMNHMVGSGNDANPNHRNDDGGCVYWPNKNSSAAGPAPSYSQGFSYTYNKYTGQPPLQEFPAVPYGPLDFHCERALNSWTDPLDLNAGWLDGLVDLNTERTNVQQRLADYLVSLYSVGFSGFRIDAAKHIAPDDLVAIFSAFRANMGGVLPSDLIMWLEVLLGGEAGMLMCNEDSGYNYGKYLEDQLYNAGWSQTEVYQIKIWNSGYPKEPDVDCDVISRQRNAVQNDDADQQNPGSTSRDMGDYGSVLIKEKNIPKHRGFEEELFNAPRGANDNDNDYPVRLLLSSYWWYPTDASNGIPDGLSDCSLCRYTCDSCTSEVSYPYFKAQDSESCGYDSPAYTRTHRDKSVILAMRNWMHMSTSVSNSDLGLPDNCVAE